MARRRILSSLAWGLSLCAVVLLAGGCPMTGKTATVTLLLAGDLNPVKSALLSELKDLKADVPDEDIVLDYAGRRTYDTCYRASYIFGVEEAILVTQWFHLDRALYICDRLGLDAVGVAADRRDYYSARYWWWREVAAVTRAWLDLNVLRPTPVLGEKLPIL